MKNLLSAGRFLLQAIAPLATLSLVAGGFASYLFYHLLKAPTLAGAKIFDEVDGFKMFLVTAEKDRLEALNPPQITPEVFERFLLDACGCLPSWTHVSIIEQQVAAVQAQVGRERVLCALSGGVDSAVAAALVHKAIGDQLTCAPRYQTPIHCEDGPRFAVFVFAAIALPDALSDG